MSVYEAMSTFKSAEDWASQAYSRFSGLAQPTASGTGPDVATMQAFADLAQSIRELAKGLHQSSSEPAP